MAFKSPEEELEQFLAAQPSWLQKILQLDMSLTDEERLAWNASNWWHDNGKVEDEFLRLLQRVPKRWREYCERKKLDAIRGLPTVPTGRPRKDSLADEAAELRRSGESYAQTAKSLNLRHGAGTTTAQAIRKLLSSRKGSAGADKT